MAAAAGTRKPKRARTARGARSIAAIKKKRARAASVEWTEGAPSGRQPRACCWCVTTRSWGHGPIAAADPAPMSRVASPSSHAAEPDYTPRTPWNSPASPSPDQATSIPAAEYAPSSRAASPDPTPPTPWNSPASPDSDYGPSDLVGYTTFTPPSRAASPDYTPSTTPSSSAFSSDYSPSTPPPSSKILDAESRSRSSSRPSSRASRVSRCLRAKTYLAFFSPRTSAV